MLLLCGLLLCLPTAQLGQSKPNVEISEDVSLPETKRKCTKRVILLSILYVAGSIQTVS